MTSEWHDKIPYGLERCIEHEHKMLTVIITGHTYPICCNSQNEYDKPESKCPYSIDSKGTRPYCSVSKEK